MNDTMKKAQRALEFLEGIACSMEDDTVFLSIVEAVRDLEKALKLVENGGNSK